MRYLYLLSICLLTACADARAPQNAIPKSIIQEHVRAFNAGDVEAMAKMQHPDIEWLSVTGKQVSVQVAGREALAKNMTAYFESPTRVTGTLQGWSVNLPFLSCLLYTSPSPRDGLLSRMPSSA